MFFSFFSSKNKKLVKRWIKEHKAIVAIAGKVIAKYSDGNQAGAKKELKKLYKVAINHIMMEDIELYALFKEEERFDEDTKKLVQEFNHSFKNTKSVLIGFLGKYIKEDEKLDEEFFNTFNEIVGVLAQRIDFEEKNLYVKLDSK